jgi:mycothiol synthase
MRQPSQRSTSMIPPTSSNANNARIEVREHLDSSEVTAVTALVRSATDSDGVSPLSEHVWLHLRHGGDDHDHHFLVHDGRGDVVGYAHLDTTDAVAGSSAELVISPESRRQGLGRMLVERLIDETPDGRLRLWSHSEGDAASALATSMGFDTLRVLWQMRRSLRAPLPDAPFPPGVSVTPFRPGIDEEIWLDVNARAFAALPDQGSWTRGDLMARMAEPWFDPAGFLMAWSGTQLVGFHWTKIHGEDHHRHEPIGEVYILGVDPAWHGRGLGQALTVAGLRHLRERGLDQVMLYVEDTNESAIALYTHLGFVRWDTDVLYRRST